MSGQATDSKQWRHIPPEMWQEYGDDALPAATRAWLEAHAASCPLCWQAGQRWQQLFGELSTLKAAGQPSVRGEVDNNSAALADGAPLVNAAGVPLAELVRRRVGRHRLQRRLAAAALVAVMLTLTVSGNVMASLMPGFTSGWFGFWIKALAAGSRWLSSAPQVTAVGVVCTVLTANLVLLRLACSVPWHRLTTAGRVARFPA